MPSNPRYTKKSDGEIEQSLEKNLDFLYRTHMQAILMAYNEGDLAHTRHLCMCAMGNYRLPKYYQNVYEELIQKIDATLAANTATIAKEEAAKRDQAAATEELACTMLNALRVTDEPVNEVEDKVRGLEAIITKANVLGGEGADGDKNALFMELLQVVTEEAELEKANTEGGVPLPRRFSH